MARVCGTEALTKPVRRWQWCRAGRQAAETRTPPPGRAWPLRYNAVKVPLKGNLVRAPSGAGPFPDRGILGCRGDIHLGPGLGKQCTSDSP